MFDLKKLFVREARARRGEALDPDSDYHPSDRKGEGLEVEYQSLIATHFRRWGISNSCVTIEVRRIGVAPDGFDVLVGMVRLAQWERLFGERFGGLFVFAYNVVGDRSPLPVSKLFEFRGGLYGFVGIPLADYARHARPISPRWDTLAMPCAQFRASAAPLDQFLHETQHATAG